MKKVGRYDYKARRMAIELLLGCDDAEKGITRLYVDEGLAAIEISERLAAGGISMTARSIQRIVANAGLIRKVGDAFRHAAKRGRIHWAYKDPRLKVAKRQTNPSVRFEILKRDGFKCVLCGNTAQNTILEVDHILAKCLGGSDEVSNLRTLCHECNIGKRTVEKEK